MKKKLTVLSTIVMIGLGSAFSMPPVKAAANTNIESIKGQRSGIQASISKTNGEISQVQANLVKLIEQSKRVDLAVRDNQTMINQTEEKMKTSQTEIDQLKQEVSTIKERIAKRNVILKERAISFQETGGSVSYIDVLLGASSFSDFVDRIGAVASMVEADQELLKQHEADKKEVLIKQTSVENKLNELTSMKSDLLGMQAQILDQKKQNDALKKELKSKEKDKLFKKAMLLAQDQSLASQELQLSQVDETQPADVNSNNSSSSDNNSSSTDNNSSSTDNNSNSTDNNSSSSNNNSNSSVSTPVQSGSGSVNDVITAGYKYIGNSVYVFGGGRTASDVANGRFDCSGFVHWAFAQAGYNIGSSTDSLKYAGRQVPASQMQPGDLVFFNTYKTDGHVGIYVGDGKFIGSQSSTGVAIASMSNSYWKSRFNGRVVRIIN
jgi:peptidoglycan DL-endopeptidase CwlO